MGFDEESQQCCNCDLQDGCQEVNPDCKLFYLVLRFVFVRQFRPALYMARAEETGTPVTIGTRLRTLFISLEERVADI